MKQRARTLSTSYRIHRTRCVLYVMHSRKHMADLCRMEIKLEAILIQEERIARILTNWTRKSPRVGLELASLQQESPEPKESAAPTKVATAAGMRKT